MSTSAPGTSGTPRFQQIAAELRRQIESGELAPGARVPSTRAIVDRWDVAMATATKVLTELRHQGLVRALPGVGTVVVRDRRPARAAPSARRQSTLETGLTSDRIVAAAIAIADAEGLEAVSMRRVASEVGVATMALYRHVKDKERLLLEMMNTVFRSAPLPSDPPAAWRPRVEIVAKMFWEACRRHTWLASAMSLTRPQVLPSVLPISEFLLASLDGLRLDHQTTMTAYLTLINYVRGTAMNLDLEAAEEAATGVDAEEWLDSQEPKLSAIVEGGQFPVFARYVSQDYDFSLDWLFEFGLARILDGLTALAGEQAP